MSWGYTQLNGPSTWYRHYPDATGFQQSPIDINTTKTVRDDDDRTSGGLIWNYLPEHSKCLINNGHSWMVQMGKMAGEKSYVAGGPLQQNKYQLEQYHCHWGSTDKWGSEHTVDGNTFAGELHLVHWNSAKFHSFGEAARARGGLAVVAILLKVGEKHHELSKLTSVLSSVRYSGFKRDLVDPVNLEKVIPDDHSYWTYDGSLTTPPCSESVIWIVMKEPIELSERQFRQFRELCSYGIGDPCPDDEFDGFILDNFRPPQKKNSRVVKSVSM